MNNLFTKKTKNGCPLPSLYSRLWKKRKLVLGLNTVKTVKLIPQ